MTSLALQKRTADRQARREGGKRFRGAPLPATLPGQPLISIITVVYNDRHGLRQTIQSVLGQTYHNIEYIIIDGASTDGTAHLLEEYDGFIDYWLSEPDAGIYEAMNKGIRHATGEWINFMNASDMFYHPDVLSSLFSGRDNTADLIYGHHECRYSDTLSVIRYACSEQELVNLWQGMPFRHQTLFIRTCILQRRPFDTSFRIGADFESIYHAYRSGHAFRNSNVIIASITADGFSNRRLLSGNSELWRLNRKVRPSAEVNLFFARKYVTTLAKMVLKAVIPNRVLELLIRFKHLYG